MRRIASLLDSQSGATTIEYAAVASLISIVAIGAMASIGSSVGGLFGMIPSF